MAPIALIGAASGWGAGFRHTEGGPIALRELGLERWLAERGLVAKWRAMLESEKHWRDHPELRGPDTYDLVAQIAAALSDEVAATIAEGEFPVVLGGDHSILMGTWAGVSRARGGAPLGLVMLDAHLDAHTLDTTPSKNAHGMGIAALLGYGHAPFRAICGGVLKPKHLCYVGVRSWEAGEMALLRRLGVRIILMEEVARRGVEWALAEAAGIATRGTTGFGLSIDLDGFDPKDAPGIGLKEPHGLRAAQTVKALARFARHPALKALEIVEYIPEFDRALRTAHLVRDLIIALLAPEPALADTGASSRA